MHRKLILAIALTMSMALSADAGAKRYQCVVTALHGVDAIGAFYEDAMLLYDPQLGTLDAKLRLGGEYQAPNRLFSRLSVQTWPSAQQNLHAVQFDPVGNGNVTPVVAWLMLGTTKDAKCPPFQFFSTGIRGVLTGECEAVSAAG